MVKYNVGLTTLHYGILETVFYSDLVYCHKYGILEPVFNSDSVY